MSENEKKDVSFKIKEHIGIINSYSTGWNKELNVVVWNDGTPKYDIRDWDKDHEHMSRGITLHPDEMNKIVDMLKEREL